MLMSNIWKIKLYFSLSKSGHNFETGFDSVNRTNIAFQANQKQTKIPWDSQKRKPIETGFV